MKEMNLLIKELIAKNIPFEIWPFIVMGKPTFQICFPSKENCLVDAVSHECSYGGPKGLIEVLGSVNSDYPNDDVVGWLTAKEAVNYFIIK